MPYTLPYVDDVFAEFHNRVDLRQLVQKWDNRFMRHALRISLNKTEFLTTGSNETLSVSAIATCGDLGDLSISDQCSEPTMKHNGTLLHA